MQKDTFQHVDYLWDDAAADQLDPVERLRYRSNLLGADQRITNTGGGNTSSKLTLPDPLTGEDVRVMYVKGSGGDLRTARRENFASLYMEKLEAQREIYLASPDKGCKTPLEDSMVAMYRHSVYNLNPRAASIDTPLHAFIPADHVDHTHPISVIAVAASADQERLTHEIYGGEVGYIHWQRPGFDLGLQMQQGVEGNPALKGFVMGQHGLINWADDDKACYELSLRLTEQAARFIAQHDKGADTFGGARYHSLSEADRESLLVQLLPRLRGMVSQASRFVGTVHVTESVLEFVNSHDAPRLAEIGTSCPDHFLRTKIKPLYVDWDPQGEDFEALLGKLESGLASSNSQYSMSNASWR
ncbi:MAG: class II aldolase/adducin family protein, partial [Chloroflexota bacterium]